MTGIDLFSEKGEREQKVGERVHRYTIHIALLVSLVTVSLAAGQSKKLRYEEGDWISYTDFRFVNSISVGHQYIYFGTTGGVTRYDRYLNRWDTPYTRSDGLSENWIENVAFDPSTEYLWCLTRSGHVNFYHPTEKRWNTTSTFPRSLLMTEQSPAHYPDFFTDFEYTFLAEGPEARIEDQNLRTYPLRHSVVDNWDNMWIATWGLNVGKADVRTLRLKMLRFGLIEPNVTAMTFDGPHMWFGGIGELHGSQGITRHNRNNDEWVYFEARYIDGLRSDNVTSIAVDKKHAWFGTYSGLVQLDKKKKSWKTFTILDGLSDNEVIDLALDDAILWIGTAFGLSSLNVETGTITKVENENIATSIVYDVEAKDSTIWAATNHGLFTRARAGKEWDFFIDREDHLGGVVAEIALDRGSVWFAAIPSWAADERLFIKTQAHQLKTGKPSVPRKEPLPIAFFLSQLFTATNQWGQHFPPETFSYGTIFDLAVNDSSVWVATDEGVLKYDRQRERWRRFTEEDGLLSNIVQAILLDGDHVWFGTPEGATRFYWNHPFRID